MDPVCGTNHINKNCTSNLTGLFLLHKFGTKLCWLMVTEKHDKSVPQLHTRNKFTSTIFGIFHLSPF